jgi:3-hydroxyisobutyrate dehydrogenase-like beta-hydroxyacid dehydrogenase
MPMKRIALLGLGRMGSGTAARLLGAGHRVTVYNRTTARAEALVRRVQADRIDRRRLADRARGVRRLFPKFNGE